jgi:hypothetical protein
MQQPTYVGVSNYEKEKNTCCIFLHKMYMQGILNCAGQ